MSRFYKNGGNMGRWCNYYDGQFGVYDIIAQQDAYSASSVSAPISPGEDLFSTVGSASWTCPANVTSVSALVIGGGGGGMWYPNGTYAMMGGGGGGTAWKNNITVVPGQSYSSIVGGGGGQGRYAAGSTSGGGSQALGLTGGGGPPGRYNTNIGGGTASGGDNNSTGGASRREGHQCCGLWLGQVLERGSLSVPEADPPGIRPQQC